MFPVAHPVREPRARGQVGVVELWAGLVKPYGVIITLPDLRRAQACLGILLTFRMRQGKAAGDHRVRLGPVALAQRIGDRLTKFSPVAKYVAAGGTPSVRQYVSQVRQHLSAHSVNLLVVYAAEPVSIRLEASMQQIRDQLVHERAIVVGVVGPAIVFD